MNAHYQSKDLPKGDLEKLGLYKDGKFLLEQDDLDALLAGRRTQLISLHELKADGFQIDQLDAKLSVTADWDGKLTLKIHPIYKQPKLHPMLNEHEAQVLIDGQIDTLHKIYEKDGKSKAYAFEYDPETREFVAYDPDKVIAPEKVNGETLTDAQKKAFRNGEVITLGDGTQFQHRASERKGLRADRAALLLSLLLDGGISYLLIRGIKALLNKPQKDAETEGYLKALAELDQKLKQQAKQQSQQAEQPQQEYKGYGKGRSR
jgi:hypothetical protein